MVAVSAIPTARRRSRRFSQENIMRTNAAGCQADPHTPASAFGPGANRTSEQANIYPLAFGHYALAMLPTYSVLLDLDGTLIDSEPGILASCLAALRAL